MNGSVQSPTTRDPTLRALIERGLARAQAREQAIGAIEGPPLVVEAPAKTVAASPRTLGLTSDRACVETNLARKGFWRSGSGVAAEGGELVRLLDATDQLGMVRRIDTGPPLGVLAFDVVVWARTRWRELGDVDERHVPFTLEAMADDLGWRKGGGAATELARALDTLRLATFRARVYHARLGETRIDTFGLLDRWERGEPDRAGRPARGGFLVLGDWLHQQLSRRHVTFVSGRSCGLFEAALPAGPHRRPATYRRRGTEALSGDGRWPFCELVGVYSSPPAAPSAVRPGGVARARRRRRGRPRRRRALFPEANPAATAAALARCFVAGGMPAFTSSRRPGS